MSETSSETAAVDQEVRDPAPVSDATGGPDSPARFVRPELRSLHAYTLEQTACRFKLDQNEVPWDLPTRLKRRAIELLAARDWARYPDFHGDELRRALAERHAWPMEGILVGNGSNELLGVSLEALCPVGGEVLGCLPSFGLYEMFVRRAGGHSRFLPPRDDLRLPLDELLAEVRRDPGRPLLLCSPNNPTGDAAPPERIEELLEALDAPLLLDNAYGEFCRWDYRPLLARYRHLLIFRTFSKAWSLGGMRLGYLLADPQLVSELIKVKLPYNLNHAAVSAGLAALEGADLARRRVEVLLRRRDQWLDLLSGFGFHVFSSQGNFLLVSVEPLLAPGSDPAAECRRVRDGLAARGVLVRDVSGYPGLRGCFRIAVGSGAALRVTAAALKEIL